jgi:hypothetical protein
MRQGTRSRRRERGGGGGGGGRPYSEMCWPRDTEPTNAGRMRKKE